LFTPGLPRFIKECQLLYGNALSVRVCVCVCIYLGNGKTFSTSVFENLLMTVWGLSLLNFRSLGQSLHGQRSKVNHVFTSYPSVLGIIGKVLTSRGRCYLQVKHGDLLKLWGEARFNSNRLRLSRKREGIFKICFQKLAQDSLGAIKLL
jgi:hypothetical protein